MEGLLAEKTPSPSKKMTSLKRNALHPLHRQYSHAAIMQQRMIFMHGGHHNHLRRGASMLPLHKDHPPLLPLPTAATASKPAFLSLPPPSSAAQSLSKTKKQPKQQQQPKANKTHKPAKAKPDDVVKGQPISIKRLGPDPGNDPKEVTRVDIVDSVFSLSPPPSSLPLPKFSVIRQSQTKQRCTAEVAAGEIDDGATDNLCRLLKLR